MQRVSRVVSGLAILLALGAQAAAQNAVTDWSLKAQNAATAGRPPGSAEYLLALVHAAIYDAAVAVEGRYRPFRVAVEAPPGTSLDAAVATAAYDVLRQRVPEAAPALAVEYAAYLAGIGDGPAKDDGIAVGTAVGQQWIALRADDGFANTVPYVQPPPGPGVWEPTAPTAPVDVKLAQVRPYVLRSADEIRPRGPRPLASRTYARDFDEVYELGRVDSTARTPEQLEIARFWSENVAIHWNRNLRRIAESAELDGVEAARMLAMVHVASADAVVACFEAKYHFLSWRPVHAIQRADTDGNWRTEPDEAWNALLNVNHPEYPSAHSCWTSAVTETLASFFGCDRTSLWLDSAVTGTTHSYDGFSDIAREVRDARVLAGIHFRSSTEDGSRIGRQTARRVLYRHFHPSGNH